MKSDDSHSILGLACVLLVPVTSEDMPSSLQILPFSQEIFLILSGILYEVGFQVIGISESSNINRNSA